MNDVRELKRLAGKARKIVETYCVLSGDQLVQGFPKGCCGVVAELLGRYLIESGYQNVLYVCGSMDEMGTHAWVEVDSIIVDITADQFGQSSLIVTNHSEWHQKWERDESRPPICQEDRWMMYPYGLWKAIQTGMLG